MKLVKPQWAAAWTPSRRAKQAASVTSLALVASTLVFLAVNADGSPVTDVELHDGSVWITNSERSLAARFNPEIKRADLGVVANSASFDLFQNRGTVVIDGLSSPRVLQSVDVANGVSRDAVELPATIKTAFGGQTVALLDSKSGKFWMRSSQDGSAFAPKTEPALTKVARDGAIAMSPAGNAYVLDRVSGEVTRFEFKDGAQVPQATETFALGESLGADLQLTVVGETPIAFDPKRGLLYRGKSAPTKITGEPSEAKLQQPSFDDNVVYIATSDGLWQTSPDKGDLKRARASTSGAAAAQGAPAAPVNLNGCVHAAWADPESKSAYQRVCEGDAGSNLAKPIAGVASSSVLVFRTNRDVVLLNDVSAGDLWMEQKKSIEAITVNWNDVDPRHKQELQEKQKRQNVEKSKKNRKPIANNDELGARPGQATILPVISNDTDPDGDILTITKIVPQGGPKPNGGYAVVGNGTQIQASFPSGAQGQATLRYDVSDGRGGTASAEVVVDMRRVTENEKPKKLKDRFTKLTVAQGQRSSAFVLQDWTDFDGDDPMITDAKVVGSGQVEFRPEGTVEFTDTSGALGPRKIELTISDGRGGTVNTLLPVDVVAKSQAKPILTPDRFSGVAGQKLLVSPLLNDVNPLSSPLTLSKVDVVEGRGNAHLVSDAATGTFTFTAPSPGTYYVKYKAYNEYQSSTAPIRLDIRPESAGNTAPVAVKDQGTLPEGGSVLIDLLANDYDLDTDVIAVQSVEANHNSQFKAALIDKRFLRVESTGELQGPQPISYTISDGQASSTGTAIVSPPLTTQANRAPQLSPDRHTMRAGQVGSIEVLENDFDPDGDRLTLLQEDVGLEESSEKAGLIAFVSGRVLKIRAPKDPGVHTVTYGVRDARGARVASTVEITVKPDSPEGNSLPQPAPIVARAIAGVPIVISLNVAGSDPDGDALGLQRVKVSPERGRIVETGPDWIRYEPFADDPGTDNFSVVLADKYGGVGVAEVRVGVVPRADLNQAPIALNDLLLVRPNRDIQFDPRTNDSDADGDPIGLLPDLSTPDGIKARVNGTFIDATSPKTRGDEEKRSLIGYTIDDGLGGQDIAFFTLASSKNAPLYAPTVIDDAAKQSEVTGKAAGETATVDVLANDSDLDGRVRDLKLHAVDTDVSRVKRGKLEVTLARSDQVIVYRVSDKDDQESYGFVFVGGTDSAPPALDPQKSPATIKSNSTLNIDLDEYVLVREGRRAILTTTDDLDAQHSDGSALLVEGSNNRLRFTPEKDYVGPASVTFEVTDGKGLNDKSGKTSLLTLPIDVLPVQNVKPAFRNVQLLVADDGKPVTFDLDKAASDPNKDQLRFKVDGTSGPIASQVSGGSTLEVTATSKAKPGDTGEVSVIVDDGQEQVKGRVLVTVGSSNRPLVALSPIEIEGVAGEQVTFDVGDFAVNPYANDPLKLSEVRIDSGSASKPAVSGTQVSLTPKSEWSGVIKVGFVVSDASGDYTRDVYGSARIVVAAAPLAPGRPQVTAMEARSVILTWSAPDDRGAPITSYQVSGSGGVDQECASTTCTITGLTPGDPYTFTVVATNKIGDSKPSAASASVVPDKRPDIVQGVSITESLPTQMDKQLEITWSEPNNEGSDIIRYEVKLEGTGEVRNANPNTTSFVWKSLNNGEEYSFRVRAINKTPEPQDWSSTSNSVKPYGVPEVMSAPTASATANGAGGGRVVRAEWANVVPSDNGNAISGWELQVFKGGSLWKTDTFDAAATKAQYDGVENGVDYTFKVRAKNNAGYQQNHSPASNVVNPYSKATAPTITGKTSEKNSDNGGCKCVGIKFRTPSDDGGRRVTKYRAEWNGGSDEISAPTQAEGANTEVRVDFGANKGPYTVTLTPITADGGVPLDGIKSNALAGVSPFGPVGNPTASATVSDRTITFSWGKPAVNGRPISVDVNIGGAGWENNVSGSSRSVTYDYSETKSIQVRVRDSEGQVSSTVSASAKTDARPKSANLIYSDAPAIGPCDVDCQWLKFSVSNFAPGTYWVDMYHGSQYFGEAKTFNVPSSGSFTWTANHWYSGYKDQHCVVFRKGGSGGAEYYRRCGMP